MKYEFVSLRKITEYYLNITLLAGGGRSILYGKRDACLARIWLVADADGGWHLFSIYGCKVDAADDTT